MRKPEKLLTYADVRDELERLYGEDAEILSGRHHARRIKPDVPIHVISRVIQGRFLLRPEKRLARIIHGIIGHAQIEFDRVKLHTYAFMSNHFHMMLMGPPEQVVNFIGYIKREISRRWGADPTVNWPGPMWHRYLCTALPTEESQVQCFHYIGSHGVKEGIVSRAEHWEGAHAAQVLLSDGPMMGAWFDGTGYSRAVYAQKRCKKPKPVDRKRFWKKIPVTLTPIMPWSHLRRAAYRTRVRRLFDAIAEEGASERGDRPPTGMKAAQAIPLNRRSEIPATPWLERNRAMICWSDPRCAETQAYYEEYWGFQRAFRTAFKAYREGDMNAVFPMGSFRPGRYEGPDRRLDADGRHRSG